MTLESVRAFEVPELLVRRSDEALKEAGLKPGDEVRVSAAGRGRLVLERDLDVVERHAGALRGVYQRGELERLRDEWR